MMNHQGGLRHKHHYSLHHRRIGWPEVEMPRASGLGVELRATHSAVDHRGHERDVEDVVYSPLAAMEELEGQSQPSLE